MLGLTSGYASVWPVWMPLRFVTKQKGLRRLLAVVKAVPMFAAAALVAYLCRAAKNAPLSSWRILCGLVFGTAADMAMEYRLATGGFLFFCGHTLHVTALCLHGACVVPVLCLRCACAVRPAGRPRWCSCFQARFDIVIFAVRAAGWKVRGWLTLECDYTAQTALALGVAVDLAAMGRV